MYKSQVAFFSGLIHLLTLSTFERDKVGESFLPVTLEMFKIVLKKIKVKISGISKFSVNLLIVSIISWSQVLQ